MKRVTDRNCSVLCQMVQNFDKVWDKKEQI